MNSMLVIGVTALIALGAAARQPLAAPLASAPDAAAIAATDTLAPASVAGPAPAAAALSLLRSSVGRRAVRVSVGQDVYELARAQFDSSGVCFTPDGEEGMPLWPTADSRPAVSPIAWERIDCIRARKSHATVGGFAGAALAVLPIVVAMNQAHGYSAEANLGWAVMTPLVAAFGAVVGGNLGAAGTWPIEWQRVPAGHGAR